MARDTHNAGVTYGNHDLEWLIRSLRFARLPASETTSQSHWVVAIDGRKGLNALIEFIRARENMYDLVYHHKTVRSATALLFAIFRRAKEDVERGLALPIHSGVIKSYLMDGACDSAVAYTSIDDSDIWTALKMWAEQRDVDRLLADLSGRFLRRELFKAIPLSEPAFKYLKEIDERQERSIIRELVAGRLPCSYDDSRYYYHLDHVHFDVVGRPRRGSASEMWIIENGRFGPRCVSFRDFWTERYGSRLSTDRYWLLCDPRVVSDLAELVEGIVSAPDANGGGAMPEGPEGYNVLGYLSRGAHKEVYLGSAKRPGAEGSGDLVALKRYTQTQAVERDVIKPNIFMRTDHPNVSRSRLVGDAKKGYWLVERLWTGTLRDFFKEQGRVRNLLDIAEAGQQLFAGLAQLHRNQLRHTDIKLENCGVIQVGDEPRTYVIGDFGCLSPQPDDLPSDESLLGTLKTRAPEVFESPPRIRLKSDVWALAATLYALCTGRYPFTPLDIPEEEKDALRESLSSAATSKLPSFRARLADELPPALVKCFDHCFAPPSDRCEAKEALQAWQALHTRVREDAVKAYAWQRADDLLSILQQDEVDIGVAISRFEGEIQQMKGELAEYVPPCVLKPLTSPLA